MSNPKLFNTFGEDVESDEEDFNPAAATVSDDEDDGGGKDVRSQRRTGQPVTGDEIANSTVTEDEVGNERRKQKDERRAGKAGEGSLRRVGAADEADRDDIEDEGSGEDIAGANGDEDEDEDEEEEEEDEEEDEDEEEVHVSLSVEFVFAKTTSMLTRSVNYCRVTAGNGNEQRETNSSRKRRS